ncbi:GNAT family N-acetyltransferase [Nocardia nova]|uniref:GNAT family N-acetyltransferase n=1 Tax=Nocardia nova TaxID=37330 RepID=UPI003408013F
MVDDLVATGFVPQDQQTIDAGFEHPAVGRWFDWYRGSAREVGSGSVDGTRVVRTHRWIMREAATARPVAFVAAEVRGPEVPGTRDAMEPYFAGLVCVVDPDRHRRGFGPASVTVALSAPELSDVAEFRCTVDEANAPSRKAVERLGFTDHETTTQAGRAVRHYRMAGPAGGRPECADE